MSNQDVLQGYANTNREYVYGKPLNVFIHLIMSKRHFKYFVINDGIHIFVCMLCNELQSLYPFPWLTEFKSVSL